MARRDDEAASGQAGPARPCVWMSAGLLAYRLCDRQYECEECPLDAALRRADLHRPVPGTTRDHGSITPPGPETGYREDRHYSPGHCWVQKRRYGCLRLGLDPFAATLMAPLLRIIFPSQGTVLERGDAFCWLQAGSRPIPLPAPARGRLLRVNERVRRKPALACAVPLDSGWLVELQPAARRLPPHLKDAAGARQRAAADQMFLDRLLQASQQKDPELGVTLADGGAPVSTLQEILGPESFARLLRRVFR